MTLRSWPTCKRPRTPRSRSSSIRTIPPAGSLRRSSSAATEVCWSSTKPSSTYCPEKQVSRAICHPARSCCDPSARPMAWPECGSVLPSRSSDSPIGSAMSSGRGPFQALPSRSAGGRSPIRSGCRQRPPALPSTGKDFDAMLVASGFEIVGGTPLFCLARHCAAERLAEKLAQQGIHVRRFAKEPHWIRFGLPANDREFGRLAAALA